MSDMFAMTIFTLFVCELIVESWKENLLTSLELHHVPIVLMTRKPV